MRRVLVVLAVLAFCSATTWADGILDVNICGTFTATSTQATETIAISFLFDPASITPYPYGNGSIDASTVVMAPRRIPRFVLSRAFCKWYFDRWLERELRPL